ncbi:hypothetical protein PV11_05543 [Exophiala sideris]|uniref:Uncharacterized protein n=1 Tax=Exophiala sideris TaxID=1016849 RepID=A0A0D1Z9X3_9EURO|nr:hypothetical protein PV11_05543 [Exophiala sideris]
MDTTALSLMKTVFLVAFETEHLGTDNLRSSRQHLEEVGVALLDLADIAGALPGNRLASWKPHNKTYELWKSRILAPDDSTRNVRPCQTFDGTIVEHLGNNPGDPSFGARFDSIITKFCRRSLERAALAISSTTSTTFLTGLFAELKHGSAASLPLPHCDFETSTPTSAPPDQLWQYHSIVIQSSPPDLCI